MSDEGEITAHEVDALCEQLLSDAQRSGYRLNGDVGFVRDLAKGLIFNQRRYGYAACPCRLASGSKEDDLDIICPCDYRDADLSEHGACYCALYVSQAVLRGEKELTSIPERRPSPDERAHAKAGGEQTSPVGSLPYPVWRCKVCGYLCARDEPPESCPICTAKQDRFERFM